MDKTGRLSAYDFPDDSPDEDPVGYVTARTARSSAVRKCPVDSSEGKSSWVGPDTQAGSHSEDASGGTGGGKPGAGDKSEAQASDSFSDNKQPLSSSKPRFGGRVSSAEADGGMSSVDSTRPEKIDDSEGMDSSISSSHSERMKMGKQHGQTDSMMHGSCDASGTAADSESMSSSSSSLAYSQRWRAQAASQEQASGEDSAALHSATSPSFSSSQPVVSSMMRDPDQTTLCSRDQEPVPLLSSQYETLSDDDDV